MPCKPVIARLLLKDGKAKCIRRTPFTIKLLYQTTDYTQDLTLGIDTGSGKEALNYLHNNYTANEDMDDLLDSEREKHKKMDIMKDMMIEQTRK